MKTKFNGILTLLLAFVVQFTFAQSKTISGTVSDDTGSLPGVSIIIKGTATGTETDFDGNYSITANVGDVLQYSFVGMETAEETVGATNTINVTMKSGNVLDEVVVTAFGIKRKPDELTTSNEVLKSEEITKSNTTNLASALTAKVSGLNIRQTSSGVNDSFSITLRGMRSFSASNQALVVIDGVPSTSSLFLALDPESVENINVMKGANGAALYGPKGANGVLIVTTKKGAKGDKFTINVKSSTDIETLAYLPERQTRFGQGWASGGVFQHFVYENGAWGPEFDGSIQPVGLPLQDGSFRLQEYSTLGSDNIKHFFQNGMTHYNGVSISAGNSNDGFVNLALSHRNREFIIKNDTQKRTSVSLRAGKKFGKLDLAGNIQYVSTSTKNAQGTLYRDLLHTATNIDIRDFEDPSNETHWNGYFYSPYWKRDNIRNFGHSNRINTSVNLGYEINENISLRSTGSVYLSIGDGYNYNNGYVDPASVAGLSGFTRTLTSTYGESTSTYKQLYGDVIANFDYELSENWGLNANTGATITDVFVKTSGASGTGLTIPGFYNIGNVSSTPAVTDSKSQERGYAVFADATFKFKDYLFLNFTGRNDWTSILNSDNNSFFYPSAGVSFVPTKAFESLRNHDFWNRIKLSYSYVEVGNASALSPYSTNDIYSQASGAFYGTFPLGGNNSFIPSASITDPFIQPEFLTSHEFNLNMELFDRRVRLDVAANIGKSVNQISNISTSYTSGLTSNRINIGEADTKGFEVDLGLTLIDDNFGEKDWRWDVNGSYATSKMTVTKVSDQSDEVATANSFANIGIFATVGEEFPLIKGTDYVRDPQGRVVIDASSGNPVVDTQLKKLGQATPKYILGLSSSLSYKNFELSFTADYRTGHKFYSGTKDQLAWSGYLVESAENGRHQFIFPNSVIETAPGVYVENTSVPTAGPNDSAFLNYYSNTYRDISKNLVLDATAFKVRDITFTYTLNQEYVDALKLSNLSISAILKNPITILAKENRGYADPESSNTSGNAVGISTTGNYPSTKTYGLSLNLTF